MSLETEIQITPIILLCEKNIDRNFCHNYLGENITIGSNRYKIEAIRFRNIDFYTPKKILSELLLNHAYFGLIPRSSNIRLDSIETIPSMYSKYVIAKRKDARS